MEIRLEGLGPLKNYFPPEGHHSLFLKEARSLRDILEDLKIPLEVILAASCEDKVIELDYHPRDGETIWLIPLVGGG
jgi:sulfur carrier protein ThiS